MPNKCAEGEIKRKAHLRKEYGGVNLCRPIKIKSMCVKLSSGEKKAKKVCRKSDIKRSGFERKEYAGVTLCKPIEVKPACVKRNDSVKSLLKSLRKMSV